MDTDYVLLFTVVHKREVQTGSFIFTLHFQLETKKTYIQFHTYNPRLNKFKIKRISSWADGNRKKVEVSYFWSATAKNSYINPILQEILRVIQGQLSHSIQFRPHPSINSILLFYLQLDGGTYK
jgi:hypothetical protein